MIPYHHENGHLCLDVLCECGGKIYATRWNWHGAMGVVTCSRQWICTKCKKERKDLREMEVYKTGQFFNHVDGKTGERTAP